MLFFAVNFLAPLVLGVLIPSLLDRWTAPHPEPHWIKSLVAAGSAILLVTLFHMTKESSMPLLQAMPLGAACSLLGALCYRGLRARQGETQMRAGKSRNYRVQGGSGRVPRVVLTKRNHSPFSSKSRSPDPSEKT